MLIVVGEFYSGHRIDSECTSAVTIPTSLGKRACDDLRSPRSITLRMFDRALNCSTASELLTANLMLPRSKVELVTDFLSSTRDGPSRTRPRCRRLSPSQHRAGPINHENVCVVHESSEPSCHVDLNRPLFSVSSRALSRSMRG